MLASYSLERQVNIRAATPCSAPWIHIRQIVVFKSKRPFSAKATDQAHWHTHAVIKSDVGTIGISDDAQYNGAYREVCRLVEEYESLAYAKDAHERARHHEQAEHPQRVFWKGTQVIIFFEKNCEFLPGRDKWQLTLDVKAIVTSAAAQMVISYLQNGRF